ESRCDPANRRPYFPNLQQKWTASAGTFVFETSMPGHVPSCSCHRRCLGEKCKRSIGGRSNRNLPYVRANDLSKSGATNKTIKTMLLKICGTLFDRKMHSFSEA